MTYNEDAWSSLKRVLLASVKYIRRGIHCPAWSMQHVFLSPAGYVAAAQMYEAKKNREKSRMNIFVEITGEKKRWSEKYISYVKEKIERETRKCFV